MQVVLIATATLLIAPYGIEMRTLDIAAAESGTFNRTLRN